MPRFFVVSLIALGVLLSGCATQQSARQAPLTRDEPVCWEPPPENTAHPIRQWCKEHPGTVAFGTTLLVLGGLAVGGAIAFLASGGGAGIVMAGMH
jgi:hypothetical protein